MFSFVRRRGPVRELQLKTSLVLVGGFGGLLGLMIAGGANAIKTIEELRQDQVRASHAFYQRNARLQEVRAGIYLSGTYVRDYLIAPTAEAAGRQHAVLSALHQETASALAAYQTGLTPADAALFQSMRAQIDDYWTILNRAFEWTEQERNRNRYRLFFELVPRRTRMMQLAEQVSDVNERALASTEAALKESYAGFRKRLLVTLGLATLAGLALACASIMRVVGVEKRAERHHRETAKARAELGELSARLVRTQEEERRALSRELHDEVGQSLSAILMEAGTALESNDGDEVREHLRSIGGLGKKTLDEIRNMALLLRPSMLDDFGLVPAIRWQAREVSRRTGLHVDVIATEAEEDLPEDHKSGVYRIVQEALNNAAKHARARRVTVEVATGGDGVFLRVSDDGAGFNPANERGLGLVGMEERVRRLGGKLSVQSKEGSGTSIRADIPVIKERALTA